MDPDRLDALRQDCPIVKMVLKNEESVFIGTDPVLEGRYAGTDLSRGAVISHPHSLMGGDMDNPVVLAIAKGLQLCDIATLRFNFRGVGNSGGRFDNGAGEGEDILTAVSFLREKNKPEILIAGYSFGAWVNSTVLAKLEMRNAILVSPPLEIFEFDLSELRDKVGLIVSADQDPYCPVDKITKAAVYLHCPLEIIAGTDHFFSGKEEAIIASVIRYCRGL